MTGGGNASFSNSQLPQLQETSFCLHGSFGEKGKRKHLKSFLMVIYSETLCFFAVIAPTLFIGLLPAMSAQPLSNCYALDKENYLYDFQTEKIGKELELEGEDSDFVLRFCVDTQNRSGNGYTNYGRFSPQSMLIHGLHDADFFHEYKYGDLMHCEHLNNDFSGREAQVKFICGTCHNIAGCKGDFGCICNITYDHDMCKVKILAAVKCGRKGPRIFPDLSVGLQPRGSEVVKNGITQREYYKPFRNYSFWSNQKEVSLYVTTKDSFPGNIETTYIQVDSSQGLLVRIVRRSAVRFHIGGERITLLQAEWKCKNASEQPYEANIRIPVKGYDPIEFSLFTFCSDSKIGSDISDWKILGSVSFLILIGVALFWFAYKLKLQGHEIRSLCTVPLIHEDNPKANEEEGLSEVGAEVALV
ncbi:hypothetical protein KP509_38G040500 [Ceratopteris richardii]|uniref:Uncharacterized protein n=1 Tax=Ceratopteris richardii TaxID=49495 RepID=A0A8T2Q4Y5_CERRI|nr:hypothetical protein KP509_38G040500 [Ceratopteris richardii]